MAELMGTDELGVPFTPRHVWSKAKRLGMFRRGWSNSNGPWTPENTTLLAEYWDKGLSAGEIGKLLGMTRNAIIGKKSRSGLASRRPKIQAGVARSKKERAKKVSPSPAPKPIFVQIQETPLDHSNPGVLIDKLKWNGRPASCRAILRDSPKGALYCGKDVSPDESYCQAHCRIYFTQYTPPKVAAG